jgi:hypothetical protein
VSQTRYLPIQMLPNHYGCFGSPGRLRIGCQGPLLPPQTERTHVEDDQPSLHGGIDSASATQRDRSRVPDLDRAGLTCVQAVCSAARKSSNPMPAEEGRASWHCLRRSTDSWGPRTIRLWSPRPRHLTPYAMTGSGNSAMTPGS